MRLRHIALLAVALFIFLARWRPDHFFRTAAADAPAAVANAPVGARITQFWAANPKIALGEKTVICYGVENANQVQLTPAVEQVWPAVTRCFDVAPTKTTEYKLTAAAVDGSSAFESTTVEVGPPRPHIIEVSVNKMEVKPGEQVVLCFKARNASAFDVGGLRPAILGKGYIAPTPARGCFGDRPAKTKTYMVKVSGPGGDDSESVTVKVR